MKKSANYRVFYKKWTFCIMAILCIIITSLIGKSYAQEEQSASSSNNIVTEIDIEKGFLLNKLIDIQSETIKLTNENIYLREKLQESISNLANLEAKYDLTQKNLESFKQQNSTSWVDWVGILLASVAAIVTTFGVFIAFFSFYGYRKIIEETKKIAAEKTKETLPEILPNYTKNELIELIESGTFNAVIENAVLKITYRGIEIETIEDI
ncbi:hypothetical protein [Shewanella sp. M-Br]|uniref:hypothetical protein n=1 Tax=Shewanella sp. M-Br TaxID=2495595 RepID=UPI0029493C03|nr:hypothetical protein SMBr_33490 [Shewanella sp. M-Br]